MSRQPFTQRWVTTAVRGLMNAGLDLKTVRIDPTTGAIVADIANGTSGDALDEIDAILDQRIAKRKSARPRFADRAGANSSGKPTKDRTPS
jgi:hypothetical protein